MKTARRRGRPVGPTLDRATILVAAKKLARDGLPQVTMAALAKTLDVTPMAIYRHFNDKHDLLSALLDDLLAPIAVPSADMPWGERLRELHLDIVRALNAYPGLSQVMHDLVAPNSARLLEGYLGILLTSGMEPREATLAYTAIYYLAIGAISTQYKRTNIGAVRPISPAGESLPGYESDLLDSMRDVAADLTQMEVQSYAIDSLIASIEVRVRRKSPVGRGHGGGGSPQPSGGRRLEFEQVRTNSRRQRARR